jgi:hypothetical protein
MKPSAKSALRATIATGIGALLMLVPGINVIILIAVMLPLWMLSEAGIPGLGRPLHGFFIPSGIGWTLVAMTFWGICYAFLLWRQKHSARGTI